tara:strand:- start:609 stop:1145 length:537 start_codon:yes stop_codon:yes gene_type:complete
MAQWGNTDDAANSVLWAATSFNLNANTGNQTNLFGNTTTGAFVTGEVVGQFGVDTSEAASLNTTAGWNIKTTGTGPVLSLTIGAGGSGYANTDTLKFTASGTGTANATGTMTTNTSGGIATVVITDAGAGFTNTAVYATFANSTGGASAGSSANVAAAIGGRAGRISYNTLVAMGSIT